MAKRPLNPILWPLNSILYRYSPRVRRKRQPASSKFPYRKCLGGHTGAYAAARADHLR